MATYFKTAMLGLDDFFAAMLLNRNDLCISAACGLVLAGKDGPLNLRPWQTRALTYIGKALDFVFKGHCAGAIKGDINRANATLALLK